MYVAPHAFRDRTADARQDLDRLRSEQMRARRYSAELREIARISCVCSGND